MITTQSGTPVEVTGWNREYGLIEVKLEGVRATIFMKPHELEATGGVDELFIAVGEIIEKAVESGR